MNKKYHYFYKIVNEITKEFYYGIHSTDNINDGYMGSGTQLREKYKKYGKKSFTKHILKFFDDRKELAEYEMKIVNENMVLNNDCYNMVIGGEGHREFDFIAYKDSNNDIYYLSKKSPLIEELGLVPIWKGLHHSNESREKIRKTMTNSKSTNSRVWVCKNGMVKYISKKVLTTYIEDGWELGRVGYNPRNGCMGISILATVDDIDRIKESRIKKKIKSEIPKPKERRCRICGRIITKDAKSGLCIKCIGKSKRKVERPSKEELLSALQNNSRVYVAKQYGVSDVCIMKWCKSYDIPYRMKDIRMNKGSIA